MGQNEEIIEEFEFKTTEGLIEVLQSLMGKRGYYQTEDGVQYSWNPLEDISYHEVELTTGQ
jgi:hypothetical protein